MLFQQSSVAEGGKLKTDEGELYLGIHVLRLVLITSVTFLVNC